MYSPLIKSLQRDPTSRFCVRYCPLDITNIIQNLIHLHHNKRLVAIARDDNNEIIELWVRNSGAIFIKYLYNTIEIHNHNAIFSLTPEDTQASPKNVYFVYYKGIFDVYFSDSDYDLMFKITPETHILFYEKHNCNLKQMTKCVYTPQVFDTLVELSIMTAPITVYSSNGYLDFGFEFEPGKDLSLLGKPLRATCWFGNINIEQHRRLVIGLCGRRFVKYDYDSKQFEMKGQTDVHIRFLTIDMSILPAPIDDFHIGSCVLEQEDEIWIDIFTSDGGVYTFELQPMN